jgi:hypothetical protein
MDKNEPRRVQYFLVRDEHQDLCESDLIQRDGAHVVVIEWEDPPHNQRPLVFIPLEAEHLKAPTKADGCFQYTAPLVDPRNKK